MSCTGRISSLALSLSVVLIAGQALCLPARAEVSIEERDRALQKNASRFRPLAPALAMKDSKFVEMTLNQNPVKIGGKFYDGFSFRTPPSGSPLHWAFTPPADFEAWYILPEKGSMVGFDSYGSVYLSDELTKRKSANSAEPWSAGIVQSLDAEALQPNTKYLMWFQFKEKKPVSISVSLNLTAFDLKSIFGKTRSQIRTFMGEPTRKGMGGGRTDAYWQFISFGLRNVECIFSSAENEARLKGVVVSFPLVFKDNDWNSLLQMAGLLPEDVNTAASGQHSLDIPGENWFVLYNKELNGGKNLHFYTSP